MSDKTALEAYEIINNWSRGKDGSDEVCEAMETIRQALEEKPCDVELEKIDAWIDGLTVSMAKGHADSLRVAAVGKPAKIKWPHRVLHGGAETIETLLRVIEHQQGRITDKEKPQTIKCTCGVIFTSRTKMINLDSIVDRLEEVLK